MRSSRTILALTAVACLLPATACRRDYATMRSAQADRFLGEDLVRSQALLAGHQPLDLDGCVRLALTVSQAVQTADLASRLAEIDRQGAFSAFLPRLSVNVGHHGSFHGVEVGNPGAWQVMSDQSVTRGSIDLVQPVFVPRAWFMYALFREGEDITRLAAERVRQQVALQVAAAYHRCLADEVRVNQLRADLAHLEVSLREVEALVREGLATPAELAAYRAVADGARAAVPSMERVRADGRVELLQAMGLHPLAGIGELAVPADDAPVDAVPVGQLVLEALRGRPELAIADRGIVSHQYEAHLALAAWLPDLVANGAITASSDSHLRFQWNANAGAVVVLSLLQGFEDVNAYRRAREREKQAYVRREQLCIAITIEVLRAHRAAADAEAACEVLAGARRAAEQEYAVGEARWREGLLTAGERLAALGRLQQVRLTESLAGHRLALARIVLADAAGRSPWRDAPIGIAEGTHAPHD
jgi:outer membrane protein TolC